MRFTARFCLAVLVAAMVWGTPATSGVRRRALGVVAQTERGHIDTTNAVDGADIYSCDSLDTDEGGVLRVKVGASQLFLSESSAAALEDDGSAIQALATSGTVGFSFSPAADLSVRTPAGIIRGAAGAASGEVAYKGPREIIISAMHGDLLFDHGGALRTIPEGKSADVTYEDNIDNSCHDESAANQIRQRPYAQHKIAFYIIAGAAVAVPAFLIWHHVSESDSTPAK
jgi:hypothetical protein